jgi:hypothetical protein
VLYKLGRSAKTFDSIDPLPFSGLPLEKELEDLLAQNLWDVLFESSQLTGSEPKVLRTER